MNGGHDVGGMHGFGPVDPPEDEPVFQSEWERRAFALTVAAGFLGEWNLDASRYARESMEPGHYLTSSYYEHWLFGLERLLEERGLLSAGELETRIKSAITPDGKSAAKPGRAVPPELLGPALLRGGSARDESDVAPKFSVGDAVRVRNEHPSGHTRAPRYARGRVGKVIIDHGVFVFPDTHAATGERNPQHCYAVMFTSAELWGAGAAESSEVVLDLWDEYLDPA